MKRLFINQHGAACCMEGSGRTRPLVTVRTKIFEQRAARVGQSRHWCMGADQEYRLSFALTARALISDVHSPMDYSPVHARWDVAY